MTAMWVAYLMIFFLDHPPQILAANHEPFETQQACHEWVEFTEPYTLELMAKIIDQGGPVKGHATVCVLPSEDKKTDPA